MSDKKKFPLPLGQSIVLLVFSVVFLHACARFQPTTGFPPEPVTEAVVPPAEEPQEPADTPAPVAEIIPEAQVRRLIPAVFAGNSLPLPELTTDRLLDLQPGGLVSTNLSGEAEAIIDGCLSLFVFQDSTLEHSTCRRQDTLSGLAVCSLSGLTGVLNQCFSQIEIQTPSASIQTSGTWFSVIYLPEEQLSLVMVYEGEVKVQAVIDPDAEAMSSPQGVPSGNLWLTVPGTDPPGISIVPAREVRSIEFWESLRGSLLSMYPRIDIWMESLRSRAEENGLAFPTYLTAPSGQVVVDISGDFWQNRLHREGLLIGIPWLELTRSTWPFANIRPVVDFGNQAYEDARHFEYDPERARDIFAELRTSQEFDNIRLIVQDWNWTGQEFAYQLHEYLINYNIESEISVVNDEQILELRRFAASQSESPFIFITIIGQVFADF